MLVDSNKMSELNDIVEIDDAAQPALRKLEADQDEVIEDLRACFTDEWAYDTGNPGVGGGPWGTPMGPHGVAPGRGMGAPGGVQWRARSPHACGGHSANFLYQTRVAPKSGRVAAGLSVRAGEDTLLGTLGDLLERVGQRVDLVRCERAHHTDAGPRGLLSCRLGHPIEIFTSFSDRTG